MYLISETTASPPETNANATFWQNRNENLRPESPRPLLSSSSSKRKILIAVLVAAIVVFIVLFGIGFYLYRRKMKLAKKAKYGLVNSPKPNEIAVEYRAHDPSVGGSLSSCGSTAPLMRQRSLRSRLGSNLTQVSEVEMPLDEKWEIDREIISLQEVLGEGAFGRVMKAEVLGMPNMPFRFNVAVKMLKGKFLYSSNHWKIHFRFHCEFSYDDLFIEYGFFNSVRYHERAIPTEYSFPGHANVQMD